MAVINSQWIVESNTEIRIQDAIHELYVKRQALKKDTSFQPHVKALLLVIVNHQIEEAHCMMAEYQSGC